MARTEAQKKADKIYAQKRRQLNANIEIPKELRERLKLRAEQEDCTMIKLIDKLLEK